MSAAPPELKPAGLPEFADPAAFGHPPGADLWVFAYGSLMWNPGFPFQDRRRALLRGWHRRFCLYSWHHRGTPERPGAVLGLDRGGACTGIAYRVAASAVPETLDYLWQREMQNYVYRPRRVRLMPAEAGASPEEGLTFTVDQHSPQYIGKVPQAELVRLIRQGVGISGRAVDYLDSLVAHLAELGIADRRLSALQAAVRQPVPDAVR